MSTTLAGGLLYEQLIPVQQVPSISQFVFVRVTRMALILSNIGTVTINFCYICAKCCLTDKKFTLYSENSLTCIYHGVVTTFFFFFLISFILIWKLYEMLSSIH